MARKWCLFAIVWLLLGCSLDAPPVPESLATTTVVAQVTSTAAEVLPSPTSTLQPTATTTATTTATATPDVTPSSVPTPTAEPDILPEAPPPAPPSPTVSPELADMSYCETRFGPEDGARFSARLESIAAEQLEQIDRLTLTFADVTGTVHGMAGCIEAERWSALAGPDGQEAPDATILALKLDAWAHDDAWLASPISATAVVTGADSFERVSFAANNRRGRGTTIGIGLRRVLTFRVRVEQQPLRIIVDVDRTPRVDPLNDPLGRAAGRADLPDAPIFFIQNYDVWRFSAGRAQPVTSTAELETALAISPDGQTLAVCRAPADAEPTALPYKVRASLWVMASDGNDQRLLADVGGCADLRFAPSGRTISFTVNTSPGPTMLLGVWTVPIVVGDPQPATPIGDMWNRWGAQWLPDSRLLYHGTTDGGLSVLFIQDEDGTEREVSAQMLTGPRYDGIGDVVVGDDLLAVEALRNDEDGADLVLLRFDGTEVAVERRGFWQRPLLFQDGELLYLLTACRSEVVQQYTLMRRAADGTIDELLTGRTLAGIGEIALLGDQLILARSTAPRPGLKGPRAVPSEVSRTSLWELEDNGTIRREVYRSPVPVRNLSVPQAVSTP